MLSEETIHANWKIFAKKVNEFNRPGLVEMYGDLSARLIKAPASSTTYHHNAFPGGYVDHVLRVMLITEKLYATWKAENADVDGFTLDELLFVALNHDLGKIGFPGEGNEHYQFNDSEWHRRNQGKVYKSNTNIPFAEVPDLSIFLLQHYGVKITWNEFLGIKVHDGLYNNANKPYLIAKSEGSKLKNSLPVIIHHADHMATIIEHSLWKLTGGEGPTMVSKDINHKKTRIKKMVNVDIDSGITTAINNIFE